MKLFTIYLWREFSFFGGFFFLILTFLFTIIVGTLNLREFLSLTPSLFTIFKVYLLTLVQLFSFVLSMSSFLGLLFAFQKLKEEREFLALLSLGYTVRDFIKPLFVFILVIVLLTFLSHFFLLPYSKRILKETQIDLLKGIAESELPVKKPVILSGDFYLYVKASQRGDNKHHLHGVLLLEKKGEKERGIYLAREALWDTERANILLKGGSAFYQKNYQEFEILSFKEYSLQLSQEALKREDLYIKRGEMTYSELRSKIKELSKDSARYHRYLSEYYQRLLYSFSIIPLLIQAFFLGLYLKSHNRFILFITGALVYTSYYLGYTFLISLGEKGSIYPLYSHLIFNGLFYILLLLQWQFLKKRGFQF